MFILHRTSTLMRCCLLPGTPRKVIACCSTLGVLSRLGIVGAAATDETLDTMPPATPSSKLTTTLLAQSEDVPLIKQEEAKEITVDRPEEYQKTSPSPSDSPEIRIPVEEVSEDEEISEDEEVSEDDLVMESVLDSEDEPDMDEDFDNKQEGFYAKELARYGYRFIGMTFHMVKKSLNIDFINIFICDINFEAINFIIDMILSHSSQF